MQNSDDQKRSYLYGTVPYSTVCPTFKAKERFPSLKEGKDMFTSE